MIFSKKRAFVDPYANLRGKIIVAYYPENNVNQFFAGYFVDARVILHSNKTVYVCASVYPGLGDMYDFYEGDCIEILEPRS